MKRDGALALLGLLLLGGGGGRRRTRGGGTPSSAYGKQPNLGVFDGAVPKIPLEPPAEPPTRPRGGGGGATGEW